MRIASFVLLALGLCVAAFCFLGLSAESIPYQDPTPAMLSAQTRNIGMWQSGLLAGLALSVVAAIGIWRARKRAIGS